ncbi:hypothetical protein MMC22_008345 [Lobaria immixta]|nr:hypothetical protein [Lobaria immixta]
MISAVEKLEELLPEFSDVFPNFDATREIAAPYMFMYYCLPLLGDHKHHLTPLENDLLSKLIDSIFASHGKEYTDAKSLSAKGLVSKRLLKYLIRPGDILIDNQGSVPRAFMATSWAMEVQGAQSFEDDDYFMRRSRKDGSKQGLSLQGLNLKTYSWEVSAWKWAFDGSFRKKEQTITIRHSVVDEDDVFEINSLEYFPLQYGKDELREVLERRGRTFWKCRFKNFVSYQEDDHEALSSIGERYMIDINTYKTLHPESSLNREDISLKMDAVAMANDDPPEGDSLLLFPPIFTGFNLRVKRWVDLNVDRVSDISWNKQAFESLVVNEKTKELVQALITNQLTAEKSTDLIRGKGNGLTILLHGGPGTGKTFTAEGVAEIAEKPLFRVTCGDVGTKPEEVEKYLESVLNLGKIWDCVVLLDEAEVFLEERGLVDLQRNAFVSVFLRVLEYNVGILILTSNRVGTFDEAFKSRIQLALHYKNLTPSQQRKIWRNFLNRLKRLDEDNVDFDDIIDHIDELGEENMNGRQIRNAITTARQLAQYKGKRFCYEHLKHVIEVSGEFENYLKDLRMAFRMIRSKGREV